MIYFFHRRFTDYLRERRRSGFYLSDHILIMAANKTNTTKAAATPKAQPKTAATKPQAKTTVAKSEAPKKPQPKAAEVKKVETASVIAAPSEDVLKKVVYQKSAQVLDRDAKPGETFGLGDSMPIYFL